MAARETNNSGTPPPLPSLGRTSRSRGVPDLSHGIYYERPAPPTKPRVLLWAWGLALAFVIGAVVVWAVTR